MEAYNLKTASSYVNNLLLARGLLRDGKQIEFARPSKGEGGSEATMATVINLVHDLILRRDSEQQHRETLATGLRTLQTENSISTAALQKARMTTEDLKRQLALAQASERSARTAQRSAETTARGLREEGIRLKQSVQQIRATCTNDVRKRDIQIQRLKGHLAEQQRGNRAQLTGASIVISPGFNAGTNANGLKRSGDASSSANGQRSQTNTHSGSAELNDPGYSLRQETAEFLTQLGQSLSDENDALIAIVCNTLSSLRELQGLSGMNGNDADSDGREGKRHTANTTSEGLPESHGDLAREIQQALAGMQDILTSPNYVPLEEVNARDEEIQRLRIGFDKIEVRWREAVTLMHDWRRRMLEGETLGIDELRAGFAHSTADTSLDADFEINEDEEYEPEELNEQDLEDALAANDFEDNDLPPEQSLVELMTEKKTHSPAYQEIKKHTTTRPLKEASGNRQYRSTPARMVSSRQASSLKQKRPVEIAEDIDDENDDFSAVDLVSTSYEEGDVQSTARALSTEKETVSAPRRVRFSASVLAATPDLDQYGSYTSPMPAAVADFIGTPSLGKQGNTDEGRRRATPYRRGSSEPCLASPGSEDVSMMSPCYGKVNACYSPLTSVRAGTARVAQHKSPMPQTYGVAASKSPTSTRQHIPIPPSPVSKFLANDGTSISPALNTPLTYHYIDPLQSLKRHSSPTRHADEPSPKMSVQEKLNLAAAEAEAAAVAAGLTLDDVEVNVDVSTFETSPVHGASKSSTAKTRRKSASRIKGRATRRRKSTLTPDELEKLMSFD